MRSVGIVECKAQHICHNLIFFILNLLAAEFSFFHSCNGGAKDDGHNNAGITGNVAAYSGCTNARLWQGALWNLLFFLFVFELVAICFCELAMSVAVMAAVSAIV